LSTEKKPRERILDAADELFYARGLHAVGIDEIVARSGTAKTTLYAHFPSKDDLIASYLQRRSDEWRLYLNEELARRGGTPVERIDAVFAVLGEGCATPGFRGCPFINAAAEYPDPAHPGRVVADAHRLWVRDLLAGLAAEGGVAEPDALAALAYSRRLDEQVLDFDLRGRELVDRDTQSRFSVLTGRAVSGPLEGGTLARVPATTAYWFAWRRAYPKTSIWIWRPRDRR